MLSLLAKYDPPENCVDITVTCVNSETWQSLNSFRKKANLWFTNLQQPFQKATFATLTNVDKLLRITDLSGPAKKELLTRSIDIMALLGHMKWDTYFAAKNHHIGNKVRSSKGHSRGYCHDSWSTKRESHNKGGSHPRPPFLGKGTWLNSCKKLLYQKNSSPAGKK